MKRFEMVKDKDLFNTIIKKGKFVKDENFVIYSLDNNSNFSHFGIAIKRSIGTSVVRNRLKRQTRAVVDNNKKLFKLSQDYIIMIREGSLRSSFQEMEESVKILMKGK